METTVKTLTYTYQPVCQCGWAGIPHLMKHTAQDIAQTHHALWHADAVCDA